MEWIAFVRDAVHDRLALGNNCMISFSSYFSHAVNSRSAVQDCLDGGLAEEAPRLVFFHATIGHKFDALVEAMAEALPETEIYGCSCAEVVGVGEHNETMQGFTLMAISDPDGEATVAVARAVDGETSYAVGQALAEDLAPAAPKQVLLYAPGMNVSGDQLIRGLEDGLGAIPIFGGYASDNMQALHGYLILNGEVVERGVIAIGLSDPGLRMVSMATHGFPAIGEPGGVTESSGNRIETIDGVPAWRWFTSRLGLAETATFHATIPVGALAEERSAADAEAYDNLCILRVISGRDGDTIIYPVDCPVGTRLWLTRRDEEQIFSKMERTMERIVMEVGDDQPVAVFHADCGARGRMAFGKVHKEDLLEMMQTPMLERGAEAWIGMYGLGEFAQLRGRNVFHNYTTALGVLVRHANGAT